MTSLFALLFMLAMTLTALTRSLAVMALAGLLLVVCGCIAMVPW